MDSTRQAHQELSDLVSAFRLHLQWRREHGVHQIPAGRCPRVSPDPRGEDPVGVATTDTGTPTDQLPAFATLPELQDAMSACKRCQLSRGRRAVVFGEGAPDADLMFIGEAPGREEDLKGRPFVGPAGQLLTKMIVAMGLERQEVYIANIIKCRPPKNRDPVPDEIDACEPILHRQIDLIRPRLIVALGNFAARTLLRTDVGITRLRGRFGAYMGIPLMPTFHPAYLLRNPEQKRPAWQDLKAVMAQMDRLEIHRRRR